MHINSYLNIFLKFLLFSISLLLWSSFNFIFLYRNPRDEISNFAQFFHSFHFVDLYIFYLRSIYVPIHQISQYLCNIFSLFNSNETEFSCMIIITSLNVRISISQIQTFPFRTYYHLSIRNFFHSYTNDFKIIKNNK